MISQYGSGTIPGISQKESSKSSSSILSIFSGYGRGLKKSGVKKCGISSLSVKSWAEISVSGKIYGVVFLIIEVWPAAEESEIEVVDVFVKLLSGMSGSSLTTGDGRAYAFGPVI